jgi:hypothetical protein
MPTSYGTSSGTKGGSMRQFRDLRGQMDRRKGKKKNRREDIFLK